MTPAIDLTSVPVVDNHCHALLRNATITDAAEWHRHFTEEPTMASFVPDSLHYRRVMRRLADFMVSGTNEESVLRMRSESLKDRLFRSANIDGLVLDTGFPPPEVGLTAEQMAEVTGCPVARLWRLETLMQDLVIQHESLNEVREALRSALSDIRGSGYVGLKSIAAYRTGLRIRRWDDAEADASFAQARTQFDTTKALRLSHKPLLDTLLYDAFHEAARQEVPVQFHTGYGDRDADILFANPLHLRQVLEDPDLSGMPVILLHESYPYTREAGYLAAVYPQVYLDLSYGIPFLSYRAMVDFTREALGVAPASKLLYSSDAVGLAEIYWASAFDGRRVIGEVLGEAVRDGEISLQEAESLGTKILRGNAIALYGLDL